MAGQTFESAATCSRGDPYPLSMKAVQLFALVAVGCAAHPQSSPTAAPPQIDPPMTVRELRKEVDPAVRWTPEVVPASRNGWNLAMKAAHLCPETGSLADVLNGKPAKPAPAGETVGEVLIAMNKPGEKNLIKRAEAALRPYGAAFKVLTEAAARPRWVAPEPRDDVVPDVNAGARIDFPVYSQLKGLAKDLVLRAQVRLKQGRPAEAASDLLLARSLGTHLAESHRDLITLLVGIAICSIADRPIQRWARDRAWTPAQLRRLQAGLGETRVGADYASTMRHALDGGLLRTIAGVKSDGTDLAKLYGMDSSGDIGKLSAANPQPFDRRDTIRYVSRILARVVRASRGPWSELKAITDRAVADASAGSPLSTLPNSGTEGVPKEQIDRIAEATRNAKNPAGRALAAILLPVYLQVTSADRKSAADAAATEVVLATALYRRAHRAEPPTLEALVAAGFLAAVPKDPFGDGPIRYDAARRVVWSVGPDGRDDGGRDAPGRFSGDVKDYVWPSDGVFSRP